MPQDPKYLVDILAANIDNENLTNKEFRNFVRSTLPLYMERQTTPTRELEPGEEPLREYSYNSEWAEYQ